MRSQSRAAGCRVPRGASEPGKQTRDGYISAAAAHIFYSLRSNHSPRSNAPRCCVSLHALRAVYLLGTRSVQEEVPTRSAGTRETVTPGAHARRCRDACIPFRMGKMVTPCQYKVQWMAFCPLYRLEDMRNLPETGLYPCK